MGKIGKILPGNSYYSTHNTVVSLQDGKYKNAPRFVLTGVVSGGRKDVSDLVLSVRFFSCQRLDGKILLVRKMFPRNDH
jgi:hypothetical protein